MNMDRIAVVALATACIGAMTACNRTHALSDIQLTQLLHTERSSATDPSAPLDPQAVDCLRAWSGDIELSGALSPAATSEAGKTACRQRIDGWIADATRNPDKVKFEEASSPASVRRAIKLLADHRLAVAPRMPSAMDRPPAALGNTLPAPVSSGPVDLTAAATAVDELDGLCQKAKKAAASGDTTQPIGRYASFCEKRIEQLRTRISIIQQNGNAKQAQMLSDNVRRTLEMAHQIDSQSKAAPSQNQ
jgi:hypothetical protein